MTTMEKAASVYGSPIARQPVNHRQAVLAARAAVEAAVMGRQEQIGLLFIALIAGGHVLLDDTPGMGKTTLARALAAALGLGMRRIQFTSDLMPSDIVGAALPERAGDVTKLVFQPGPIFTNFLLADEINRASPRTQSALLEAMAERQVTAEGSTMHLPDPFVVIATQNPVDLSGTFPLPESQMDRFMFRFALGYPARSVEIDILMGQHLRTPPSSGLSTQDLVSIQKAVASQTVTATLAAYIADLSAASRAHPEIKVGLSPRASLAVLAAAKAQSWLAGRDYVSPDDVQHVFVAATAHRLGARSRDQAEQLAADILASTRIP